jgi:hypothetical protein
VSTGPNNSVSRFLDVPAGADAMELLGLTPSTCVPAKIEAALERQLERVDQHPQSDTPEADDVRLALHTAAAQLLDVDVRKALIERAVLREDPRSGETSPQNLQPWAAPIPGADRLRDAEPSIHEPVPTPAADREPLRETQTRNSPRVEFTPFQHDRTKAGASPLLWLGALALVCLALLGGLMIALSSRKAAPATGANAPLPALVPPPIPTVLRTAPPGTPDPAPAAPPESEFTDPSLIVRQLQGAVVSAKADEAAGWRAFESALPALAEWWCRFDRSQRVAAESAVVDFVFLLGEHKGFGPSLSHEIIDRSTSVTKQAAGTKFTRRDIWAAAWSIGMMQRLTSQSELPRAQFAPMSERLIEIFGPQFSAIGTTFESGVRAALVKMAVQLSTADGSEGGTGQDSQAGRALLLKSWLDAVVAVSSNQNELDGTLAESLEQVLVAGNEPSSDASVASTIEFLASRTKWRPNTQSRERLIAWFNDPRISDDDLSAVTRALATKSGAENIQPDMVLSTVAASPDDRAKLRSRYAQAWGLLKAEVVQSAIQNWMNSFSLQQAGAAPASDVQRMAELVHLVRLNDAARRIWLGDPNEANSILSGIPALKKMLVDATVAAPPPVPMPTPPPNLPTTTPPRPVRSPGKITSPGSGTPSFEPTQLTGQDGDWALAYLKAEHNIPMRLERLNALSNWSGAFGPIDAGVLMEAACFGSPAQVRMAAQMQVQRFTDDPAIVNAALNALPAAPKIWSVAECYAAIAKAKLPKVGDPDWELLTRRALVERLLSMVSTRGESSAIETGEGLIAESYKRMSGSSSGDPSESNADLLARSANALYSMWRLEADRLPPPARTPLTLEQIQRRRDGRMNVAAGPTQSFAAEQAAVSEILAYVVCAERPLEQAPVTEVLALSTERRRHADHVLMQMIETELAISRLWRIRLRALDGGAILGAPGSSVLPAMPGANTGAVMEVR